VQQHPDKTFIGRIARGFDFLGYRFSSSGLSPAPRTIKRFEERMARLYEQGADASRIGAYARHWWRWVEAGVTLPDEVRAAWEQTRLESQPGAGRPQQSCVGPP